MKYLSFSVIRNKKIKKTLAFFLLLDIYYEYIWCYPFKINRLATRLFTKKNENVVLIGDCTCNKFKDIVKTYTIPHTAAKRLMVDNKLGNKIINILKKENTINKTVCLYFGNFDVTAVINYKYNTQDLIDFEEYILECAKYYCEYLTLLLKEFDFKKLVIFDITKLHYSDVQVMRISKARERIGWEKYVTKKVIPLQIRKKNINLFNNIIEEFCKNNNIYFLKTHKNFTSNGVLINRFLPDFIMGQRYLLKCDEVIYRMNKLNNLLSI